MNIHIRKTHNVPGKVYPGYSTSRCILRKNWNLEPKWGKKGIFWASRETEKLTYKEKKSDCYQPPQQQQLKGVRKKIRSEKVLRLKEEKV